MINILPYKTLEDINNTNGLVGILQTASDAVPILPALIMSALFIVIVFANYFSTQRRTGRGDLPSSFAVAGFVTCIVGGLISMIPNFMPSNILVNPLSYFIILEIVFIFWLFLSRE